MASRNVNKATTAVESSKKKKKLLNQGDEEAEKDDGDFEEMLQSAQKLNDLVQSSDFLTKADLKNYASEISSKPTAQSSFTREYNDESSDEEEDEDFISPTRILMNKIPKKSTRDDIIKFFRDKLNTEVDIKSLMQKPGDKKKHALIEFGSTQEVKEAIKLNGEVMGKKSIFICRVAGREIQTHQQNKLRVYCISGFKRRMPEDDVKKQVEEKFKECYLVKIILPKNEETGRLEGYECRKLCIRPGPLHSNYD